MRGNIRTWCVLGALASAAWVFPGCKSDSREPTPREEKDLSSETMIGTGTGGSAPVISAPVIMEDSEAGIGGSGSMKKSIPEVKRTSDAGTAQDSGTGGSEFDPSAVPNTVPHNTGRTSSGVPMQ